MENAFMANVITVITLAAFSPVSLAPSFPVAFDTPAPSAVPTVSLVPAFLIPSIADTWDKKEIINLYKVSCSHITIPYWFTKKGKIKKYSLGAYVKKYPYLMDEILKVTEKPLFKCCKCGEILPISEMENYIWGWEENDLINGECLCGCCYEGDMGEDL